MGLQDFRTEDPPLQGVLPEKNTVVFNPSYGAGTVSSEGSSISPRPPQQGLSASSSERWCYLNTHACMHTHTPPSRRTVEGLEPGRPER